MTKSIGIKNIENIFPGLRDGSVNLLYGPPGSGKTLLGLQFLIDGLNEGNILYISLDQSAFEVKRDFEGFAWNLGQVSVIDAVPTSKKREIRPYREVTQIVDVKYMKDLVEKYEMKEIDVFNLRSTLKNILEKRKFSRVVVDSITSLKFFYTIGIDPDVGVLAFIDFLKDIENTTVLLISEEFGDLSPVMRSVENVLRIYRNGENFYLEFIKTRDFVKKSVLPLKITEHGFEVMKLARR